MIIDNTIDLTALCDRLAQTPFVTVDTEFIREKTFYPVLCLIQIASSREAHCIDPLAPGIDLSPLYTLFKNPRVVKVFHACRQDIEIFYHEAKCIPTPLFDTQTAAMVCGYGESVSYRQLVLDFLKIPLDKSARFTDWSARPLSEKQIEYALHDVTYLRDVYQKLKPVLDDPQKALFIEEEIRSLSNPQTYDEDPENIWQRFKCPFHKSREVAIFQKIYAWREYTARRTNKPRRCILKDEAILELCAVHPTTEAEMNALRSFPKDFGKTKVALELIGIIRNAMEAAKNNPEAYYIPEKVSLSSSEKTIMELIRLLLDIVSEKTSLASKLIASHEDIRALASGCKETKCLTGWRYDLFGQYVEKLKKGLISFRYDPNKKRIEMEETNRSEYV